MTVGNLAGGRYADRSVAGAMFVFFALLVTGLIGLALTAQTLFGLLICVFVIGSHPLRSHRPFKRGSWMSRRTASQLPRP
jgi:predicted MFS family arabinose efflux permease